MLRLGYQVLVENMQLLSTCQLVNLIGAPVCRSVLSARGRLADPSSDLSVGECSRVMLVKSISTLAILKYAIV